MPVPDLLIKSIVAGSTAVQPGITLVSLSTYLPIGSLDTYLLPLFGVIFPYPVTVFSVTDTGCVLPSLSITLNTAIAFASLALSAEAVA